MHSPQPLLVATKNAHKTQEIQALLGNAWAVTDLTAHPEVPSPEETGDTFPANAAIKALAASLVFSGLVLADDSGLEVDALGGAPGVYSARYAGEGATDAANRVKLLTALVAAGAGNGERTARFRCAIVLARGGQPLGTFEGAVEGAIALAERGTGGFGYDSLFIPAGFTDTFGELPAEIKNRFSHRAAAMAKVADFLQSGTVSPAPARA